MAGQLAEIRTNREEMKEKMDANQVETLARMEAKTYYIYTGKSVLDSQRKKGKFPTSLT
jgi:GH25 family lysozyme M1 (1,4-beta-N-acetylmuramidase)